MAGPPKFNLANTVAEFHENNDFNISQANLNIIKITRHAGLLPAYSHVFDGRVGEHLFSGNSIPESVKLAVESLNKHPTRKKRQNAIALLHFLDRMSVLTNEIDSPLSAEDKDIVTAAIEDQNYFDEEALTTGDAPNYLANMLLSHELFCLNEDSFSAESALTLTSFESILEENLPPQANLDSIRLVNPNCSHDLGLLYLSEQVGLFKSQSKFIKEFFVKEYEEITYETPTDLPKEEVYSMHNVEMKKKLLNSEGGIKEISRKVLEEVKQQMANATKAQEESRQGGSEEVKEGNLDEEEEVEEGEEGWVYGEQGEVGQEEEVGEQVNDVGNDQEPDLGNEQEPILDNKQVNEVEQDLGAQQAAPQGQEVQPEAQNAEPQRAHGVRMPGNEAGNAENAGGGWFGGVNLPFMPALRRFWNNNVLPPKFRDPELDDKEQEGKDHLEILESIANSDTSEAGEYSSIVADLYFHGVEEYKIKPNITKATFYYERSADLGYEQGMINAAALHINLKNWTTAEKYLHMCIEHDITECHYMLGVFYLETNHSKVNEEKAIRHFQIAADRGDVESIGSIIDLSISGETINAKRALKYMDVYYNELHQDIVLEHLTFVGQLAMETEEPQYFHRYTKVLLNSKVDTEMITWYKLGERKYKMGEFDRALMVFSFTAMQNHVLSAKAAGLIWERNLTQNLTCGLGHHYLCSSYFYLKAYMLGDEESIMHFAQNMYNLAQVEDNSLEYDKQKLLRVAFYAYNQAQRTSQHAKFNLAQMMYKGEGTQSDKQNAYRLLNEITGDILNKGEDYAKLTPVLLAKWYFKGQDMLEMITSLDLDFVRRIVF